MKSKFLKKFVPDAKTLTENPALKPVRHLLIKKHLFHLNRRSVARATFIGIFCSFIPVPWQMIIAAALCVFFRANVPLGVALVWISNPVTMGPIFYFTYKLGAWILEIEANITNLEFSIGWLWTNLVNIGYPLLVGSIICGWVSAITGYAAVHFGWRLAVIRSWKKRQPKTS